MGLQARLTTRAEQGLALMPKMLQSIEVLQLATADLLALIDREIEQNETLSAEPKAEEPADELARRDSEEVFDPEGWRLMRPIAPPGEDRKLEMLHNVPGPSRSLLEHIEAQLGVLDVAEEVATGVHLLAERLDERGLLAASDDELLEVLDAELLGRSLDVLQTLEPRGIGARDPVGAMLLQLPDNDPDLADIATMLTQHLDALARNKLPEVARALGRTVDEIGDLLERIRRLDPHPGAGFHRETGFETIHPDIAVRLVGDRIEVEIDDMVLPDLGIHEEYAKMSESDAVDRDTRSYLRGKLRSARELIHAVEQRQRTLARVTLAIMRQQIDFLVQGPLAVHSLCMHGVAEELGLHPSTVSRAIAGKYVQTDHGIYRLHDFFDGDRRSGAADGEGTGRLAIKDHIRDLVDNEDPAHPLSDDDLVRALLPRNIKVARRTVAKYRKELGVPSSWRRRKY